MFVAEELPEQELINLAQQYMLPQTSYNYLKKPPCPGYIGCDEALTACNNSVLEVVDLAVVVVKALLVQASHCFPFQVVMRIRNMHILIL